jgi:Ca2+-transporting ATPase
LNAMSIHAGPEPAIGRALWQNPSLLIGILVCSAITLMALYLPWANELLKTQPLTLEELGVCIAFSGTPFIALELGKWRIQR